MTRMRPVAVLVLFAIAVAELAGCMTYRAAPLENDKIAAGAVKVGDKVRVRTRAGETLEFEVTSIEDGGLAGRDERVAQGDVETLEVEGFNKRAMFITLGVIGAVLLDIERNKCDNPGPAIFSCND